MVRTHRRYRYDRRAWRAQWYLGPWKRLGWAAPLIAGLAWWGGGSLVAAALAVALAGIAAWRGWREWRQERAGWQHIGRLSLRFEPGRLVLAEGDDDTGSLALDRVVSIDVVMARGRVQRLLVDDEDGTRQVFAALDDMQGFLREFRSQTPTARLRRMKP